MLFVFHVEGNAATGSLEVKGTASVGIKLEKLVERVRVDASSGITFDKLLEELWLRQGREKWPSSKGLHSLQVMNVLGSHQFRLRTTTAGGGLVWVAAFLHVIERYCTLWSILFYTDASLSCLASPSALVSRSRWFVPSFHVIYCFQRHD